VHSGEFPDIDVGMVSDGHGFEDSPDCERIAGGVNSKGAMAVAIGREANLLQWGFYGAPDRMTEPAKRAFLNAIVWMKQFRGQRPLVTKQGRGRGWLAQYIDMIATQPASQYADPPENSLVAHLKKQFPPELVADGIDLDRLREWYADNEPYFGPGADRWKTVIDDDLKAIGIGNRQPEFLDWLLQAVARDPDDERALRLAQRYLGEHGSDAATARAFLTENEGRLFFSDAAGYRWLVDTNAARTR
jgi:hypothetical protein